MTKPCGCCSPGAPAAPLVVDNRPGLSAVTYRIGTYASFREAMLEAIAGAPELAGLTTRRSDDYAVTLLELWAAVADVLTFYQERYANEAFLRTAVRRESVARLAQLIDYRLGTGVAALAQLAFTVEDGKRVEIPKGLRVQSVPENGADPQVFETIEPLTADARLNGLRVYPLPTATNPLAKGAQSALLRRGQGPALSASLPPGARVVLFKAATPVEEKAVAAVETDEDRVTVRWTQPVDGAAWSPATTAVHPFKRSFRLFGYNAPPQFMAPAEVERVAIGTKMLVKADGSAKAGGRAVLKSTTAGAASAAPKDIKWALRRTDFAYPQPGSSAESGPDAQTSRLCLDGRYENLAPGQQVLVADTVGQARLVTVTKVDQASDALGGVSDTVTRVTVRPSVPALADRRSVVVYDVGNPVALWSASYPSALAGDTVYLPGRRFVDADGEAIEVARTIERGEFAPGVVLRPKEIEVGRTVLLGDDTGKRVVARVKAPATITAPDADGFAHLALRLDVDGTLTLATDSATLFGNVALATHGETVRDEIVGSGNAARTFQQLELKKKPLTYVPTTGTDGVEPALLVQVNGVRWSDVPDLYGQPADARVFAIRTDGDGTTRLQFGDGTTGARLPTGQANVKATYRMGVGVAGRVRADKLTTALDRPAGLVGVTNPLPATGGADAETIEPARRNAPRTVRAFGRAVSFRDFEELVTASGEVAKAQATWVWDGLMRALHLTVAGQAGGAFTPNDLRRLGAALTAARDPNHPLRLDNYVPVSIVLRADVAVDPAYARSTVAAAARAAALAALSFDALELGRPLHLSDVYRVLQAVPGVAYVDVNEFQFKLAADRVRRAVTRVPDGQPAPVQDHLRVSPARPDASEPGGVIPAELARLEVPTQDLTITGTGGLDA